MKAYWSMLIYHYDFCNSLLHCISNSQTAFRMLPVLPGLYCIPRPPSTGLPVNGRIIFKILLVCIRIHPWADASIPSGTHSSVSTSKCTPTVLAQRCCSVHWSLALIRLMDIGSLCIQHLSLELSSTSHQNCKNSNCI